MQKTQVKPRSRQKKFLLCIFQSFQFCIFQLWRSLNLKIIFHNRVPERIKAVLERPEKINNTENNRKNELTIKD